MRKLILANFQCPGDVVMLTAAVRDLHRCYPGQFLTDVRTDFPELWENNPHLTPLDPRAPGVEVLNCRYPLIRQANERPVHFIHGFIEYLNERLGLEIRVTDLAGDVHLSERERQCPSPVEELAGWGRPYWIIAAGGKFDLTIKWWLFRRWQSVVDHFREYIQFVQIGEVAHHHPLLRGVIDLRGRTSLRDLVRLVHRAAGVLCPVTLLMHLAAAVERPVAEKSTGEPRPCVVVAGGREPATWESYPGQRFLHTIGLLPCCAQGGCWRSRSVPLGDGDEKDRPEHLCLDTVRNLPRCMDMITPGHVIDAIESYERWYPFHRGVAPAPLNSIHPPTGHQPSANLITHPP